MLGVESTDTPIVPPTSVSRRPSATKRCRPSLPTSRLIARSPSSPHRQPAAHADGLAGDIAGRRASSARNLIPSVAVSSAPVVVLAGGTGGAKLARGMLDVVGPEALAVVANTGDDI